MKHAPKMTAAELEGWYEKTGSLTVVDREYLHQLSEGDEDFELELLQTFVKDAEERLRQLHVAIATTDHLKVQQQAHQLRGASAGVGVTAMHLLARQLESDDFQSFPHLLRLLEERLEAVRTFTTSLVK